MELEPNRSSVRGSLGLILMAQGRFDEARAALGNEPVEWQRVCYRVRADAKYDALDRAG